MKSIYFILCAIHLIKFCKIYIQTKVTKNGFISIYKKYLMIHISSKRLENIKIFFIAAMKF